MATLTPPPSLTASENPAPKLPFGVKVIIVLQLATIIGWLLGLTAFWYSPDFQFELQAELGPGVGGLISVLGLLIVALQLLIVYGLLRLRPWAWYMVILLAGLSLAANLWRYFADAPSYLMMVINVLTVLYLNQREVQQPFRQPSGQPSRQEMQR